MFMYFEPRTTEKDNCHMSRDIVWCQTGGDEGDFHDLVSLDSDLP